jgi:hypothetical protein
MFDKEKALWTADGRWVRFGAGLNDETGWETGSPNVGELQADRVVRAHNQIIEDLYQEHDKLKKEIIRAAKYAHGSRAQRAVALTALVILAEEIGSTD